MQQFSKMPQNSVECMFGQFLYQFRQKLLQYIYMISKFARLKLSNDSF